MVGEDYVGGVVGFNDVNATIKVNYTLIGGRIYAFGKCAGGAFGLNASASVTESDLKIRPQVWKVSFLSADVLERIW